MEFNSKGVNKDVCLGNALRMLENYLFEERNLIKKCFIITEDSEFDYINHIELKVLNIKEIPIQETMINIPVIKTLKYYNKLTFKERLTILFRGRLK